MKRFFYSLGISKKTFSSNITPILVILITSLITVTNKFNGEHQFALWFMFILFEWRKIMNSNSKIRRMFILSVLFLFICVFYKLLGVSSAKMGFCIGAPILYYAPMIALVFIDKYFNEQQIRFLFHLIALAIAINIADNIRLSHQYGVENIVFQNLGGKMAEQGITGLNLGGTTFVNMIVFYACTMFFAFLVSNKWQEKLLFLTYVGISSYFVIICSIKASAVILLLLSLLLMYVAIRSKRRLGILITLITIVGGLTYLLSDVIVNFFVDFIGSDRIAQRLIIFTSEHDVEESGTLLERTNLWMVSLRSWLGSAISFFFGIGDHNYNDFMTTEASGIGSHSDLFDVLGKYGILGASIFYSSIKIYYDYLQKKHGDLFKYEIIVFFILFLGMGFTKKIVAAQPAIVIFILFPLALRYISNTKLMHKK